MAKDMCDLGASGAIRGAFKAGFGVKTLICSTDYNIGYSQFKEKQKEYSQ